MSSFHFLKHVLVACVQNLTFQECLASPVLWCDYFKVPSYQSCHPCHNENLGLSHLSLDSKCSLRLKRLLSNNTSLPSRLPTQGVKVFDNFIFTESPIIVMYHYRCPNQTNQQGRHLSTTAPLANVLRTTSSNLAAEVTSTYYNH